MLRSSRGRVGLSIAALFCGPVMIVGSSSAQGAVPSCHGKPATIAPTGGEGDGVDGTAGDDVIVIVSDRVMVFGHGGDDTVCSSGDDTSVFLGEGDDWVQLSSGNDRIFDSGGLNQFFAGAGGHDGLHYDGSDFLDLPARTDDLSVDLAAGTVTSEDGTGQAVGFEFVTGGAGDDVLKGTDAVNVFGGSGGDDEMYGRGGNDQFETPKSCPGADRRLVAHGGDGDDYFSLADGDEAYGDAGRDTGNLVFGSVFHGGSGDDRVQSFWEKPIGGEPDQTGCYAHPQWLFLLGGRADGGSGHDTLETYWDDDNRAGGLLADLGRQSLRPRRNLRGDPVHVTGFEVVGGTSDADVMYGDGGDNRLYGRGGADRLRGAAGRDHLNGGDGRDVLYGGPGRDELLGKSGNDRLDGGTARDRLDGGSGTDRGDGGPARDTCVRVEHRTSC